MKVEELNNGFKPIEIKLTIESEQELCNLWHRLNISSECVNKATICTIKHECSSNVDSDLWSLINNKVSHLGLNKK